ncbi:MAG TPA: hypothetical protein VF292_03700 [Rhodanobacteraceae bacterium]
MTYAVRDAQPRSARQGGLTLIGLAIATALLAIIVAGLALEFARYERQQAADRNGQALAQMATGLSAYIDAVQGGTVHVLGNPEVEYGFAWLKPPTCGGLPGNPTTGFVPCAFDPGANSAFFVTTVQTLPATGTTQAVTMLCAGNDGVQPSLAGTCAGPDANTDGRRRMLLQAAMVARAARANAPPHDAGFVSAFSNTPPGAPTQLTPQQVVTGNPFTQGLVTLVVNDNPAQDPFLRVDGSNHMLANLNVGGHGIADASTGDFSGVVTMGSLTDNGAANVTGIADLHNTNVAGTLGVGQKATFYTTTQTIGAATLNGPVTATDGATISNLNVDGQATVGGDVKAADVQSTQNGTWLSSAVHTSYFLTGKTQYTVPAPQCTTNSPTPEIYVAIKDTGASYPSPAVNDYSVGTTGNGPWVVYPMQQAMTYTVSGQLSTTGSLSGSLNPIAQGWRSAPSMQIMATTWCD